MCLVSNASFPLPLILSLCNSEMSLTPPIRSLKTAIKSLLCLLISRMNRPCSLCFFSVMCPTSLITYCEHCGLLLLCLLSPYLLPCLRGREVIAGFLTLITQIQLLTRSIICRHLHLLFTGYVRMRRGNSAGSLSVLLSPHRGYRP